MSDETSIYRTLATIEAEESALRYCKGCGMTKGALSFRANGQCADCQPSQRQWCSLCDAWEYHATESHLPDRPVLNVNQEAIVQLIRNHRAEFDAIVQDEREKRELED
jgi:hypothetical protein